MDRGEPRSQDERRTMTEALAMEIESLRKLKTKALKVRYRELFGEESRSSNRAHLFRRIAWRLQAKAEGDLSERARKRATELANDVDLRLRAPRRFWRADGTVGLEPCPARDPRLPPAGTLLILPCYKRREQQKGQYGNWVSRKRAILIRRVAIEVGLCRSARTRRTARLEV